MTVQYSIEAKPTFYNGVQFRSRLEARWASWFDIMSIDWTYEPIDFGAWSPDFMLDHKYKDFVEVKPITEFDKETGDKMMKWSKSGGIILCGLDPNYCWLNTKGWWDKFTFSTSDLEHWKSAGNVVQWSHS